jgi:hypothetical protein
MDIDAALTLLALLGFFALIVSWIATPLHASEPTLESSGEAAQRTAATA